jgi:hypothetical protein
MANTLLTIGAIARMALANLYERTIAAQMVTRDYDGDFNGAIGDTVTVRKPAIFAAGVFNRSTGIVIQDATENSTTVKLDTLLDVSFAVTAEQWSLSLQNFNTQLIVPAVEAIAQGMDQRIIAALIGATGAVNVNTNASAGAVNDPLSLITASKKLNDAKVPHPGRIGIVTTSQAAGFLSNPLFIQYLQRGDTEGLIEASLGRKFEFDLYQTSNFPSGGKVGVAFHPSGFALVTRTLLPPAVAPQFASVAERDGFGLRVVRGYDITKKQDIVSLDVLMGLKVLDANRIVTLTEQ